MAEVQAAPTFQFYKNGKRLDKLQMLGINYDKLLNNVEKLQEYEEIEGPTMYLADVDETVKIEEPHLYDPDNVTGWMD